MQTGVSGDISNTAAAKWVQCHEYLALQKVIPFFVQLVQLISPTLTRFSDAGSQWLQEEPRRERECLLSHNMVIWYLTSPGTGTGTHQYLDLGALKLTGLGRLTCFVGYCVGFGHRLLITQVDRGAPLESTKRKSQGAVQWDWHRSPAVRAGL